MTVSAVSIQAHWRIVDLPLQAPAWKQALPVLRELRHAATFSSVNDLLENPDDQGVRFFGVFSPEECLGVAGYRIMLNTSSGRKLYVDDLVTTTSSRSSGVGRFMMAELKRRAALSGCSTLALDSGVQRHDAHRFYLHERMAISAHHFDLTLSSPPEPVSPTSDPSR